MPSESLEFDLGYLSDESKTLIMSGSLKDGVVEEIERIFEAVQTEIATGLKVVTVLEQLLEVGTTNNEVERFVEKQRKILEAAVKKILKASTRVHSKFLRQGGELKLDTLLPQTATNLGRYTELMEKHQIPETTRKHDAMVNMCLYYRPEEVEEFFESEIYTKFYVNFKRYIFIAFSDCPQRALTNLKEAKATYDSLVSEERCSKYVPPTNLIWLAFRHKEPQKYLEDMWAFFDGLEGSKKDIFDAASRTVISEYIAGNRNTLEDLLGNAAEVKDGIAEEIRAYISDFIVVHLVVKKKLTVAEALAEIVTIGDTANKHAHRLSKIVPELNRHSALGILTRSLALNRKLPIAEFEAELKERVENGQGAASALHDTGGKYVTFWN